MQTVIRMLLQYSLNYINNQMYEMKAFSTAAAPLSNLDLLYYCYEM